MKVTNIKSNDNELIISKIDKLSSLKRILIMNIFCTENG